MTSTTHVSSETSPDYAPNSITLAERDILAQASAPVDVLAVIEADGQLTPDQLASSGSVDDLHRWMAECIETRAHSPETDDASEALTIWQACRDELDRRNGAQS